MPKLWFAAKRYGYGWYPVTWEGWLLILGFLVLLLMPPALASVVGPERIPESVFAVAFSIYALTLAILLVTICFIKGEPARWRWGDK